MKQAALIVNTAIIRLITFYACHRCRALSALRHYFLSRRFEEGDNSAPERK